MTLLRLPLRIREDAGEADILDASGESIAHADLGWPESRAKLGELVRTANREPAVVALVEAAQGMVLWDYVGDADQDAYDRLAEAVAAFTKDKP